MPFDSSPQKTKDQLSLESLVAWLETMPAEQEYCWADAGRCLYHQYGQVIGRSYSEVVSELENRWGTPTGFFYGTISVDRPHTFGGALDRARHV